MISCSGPGGPAFMGKEPTMLTSIALILLTGLLIGWIARKLQLPAILGMIVAGILIGPYGFNLLDGSLLEVSSKIREMALVIILTRAGLSLDPRALKKVWVPTLLLCFVPAVLEIGGTVLLGPPLLGIGRGDALLIGAVLAAISPAVILPRMIRMMEEGRGASRSIPQMLMAGTAVGDALVIVLFGVLAGILATGRVHPLAFAELPASVLTGVFLGAVTAVPLSFLFRKAALKELGKVLVFLGVSLLFLQLEAAWKAFLPISAFLAIMTMSAFLRLKLPAQGESLYRGYSKIWEVAEILLFVLIGTVVDPESLAAAGGAAVLLILGALAFRMAGVWLSLVRSSLSGKERLFCMSAYVPKATVQAAIGGIPLAMGLPSGELVLSVAILSILLTAPSGALLIDRFGERFLPKDQGA